MNSSGERFLEIIDVGFRENFFDIRIGGYGASSATFRHLMKHVRSFFISDLADRHLQHVLGKAIVRDSVVRKYVLILIGDKDGPAMPIALNMYQNSAKGRYPKVVTHEVHVIVRIINARGYLPPDALTEQIRPLF